MIFRIGNFYVKISIIQEEISSIQYLMTLKHTCIKEDGDDGKKSRSVDTGVVDVAVAKQSLPVGGGLRENRLRPDGDRVEHGFYFRIVCKRSLADKQQSILKKCARILCLRDAVRLVGFQVHSQTDVNKPTTFKDSEFFL